VTDLSFRTPAGEQARIDECGLEPIRTPGSIQSHGALVVVDAADFRIRYVSENALAILGVDPAELIGSPLSELTGVGPLDLFAEVLNPNEIAANPALVAIHGKPFDAILHQNGSLILIDFEPSLLSRESQSMATLFAAIHRLALITTATELWAATAREVQRITHFDHVMVYRFHADAHGEIVGEDVAEGMEPYLGLHYPASDIPAQARELYVSKLSRVIASSSDTGSALLASGDLEGAATLDLSEAELRSVSPHHLQFMRNMGQSSTMSFSLVRDGQLIGMITCAHRTPRRVSFVVRQGLEVLANQVALQLSSLASIEQLTRRMTVRAVRTDLIAGLTDNADIPENLLRGRVTLLDFIPADGVTIRLDGQTTSLGSTPTFDELEALTRSLRERDDGLAFATDALPIDHPDLSIFAPTAAGILMVPLGGEGDYVAWFRNEVVHTRNWLGDQTESNRQTPLSPRNSFSAWTADVTDTAPAWDDLEAEAAELGRDLDGALFRRAESRLAHVALHDPLTGLPNRRLLMDRLDHALSRYARGEEVALLFIDLDGFKAVNDTLGHDAGDELLRWAADQLRQSSRAEDTIARIGGDEFVILCEHTSIEEAEILAARILGALRRPSGLALDAVAAVTASVGIASADLAFGAIDLLKQADAAMYRAKTGGRDRASR
jgi:chemotaxis family two-component system sensor kinase Cph1